MASITTALIAATLSMHPINAPLKNNDLYCVAAAVYYETRGTSAKAQQAVAHVVLTRQRLKQEETRNKVSACSIIRKPSQFPWAKNRRRAVLGKVDRIAWERSVRLAARVMAREIADPTKGATHFCHKTEVSANLWCRTGKHKLTTDNMRFVMRPDSALVF